MAKVAVPAVPARAFNPNRPASDLVKTAIKQLQTALLAAVDTEAEAARCIEVLTALLHEVRPSLIPRRHGSSSTRRRQPGRGRQRASAKRKTISKAPKRKRAR